MTGPMTRRDWYVCLMTIAGVLAGQILYRLLKHWLF